jgi:hypothetical protein
LGRIRSYNAARVFRVRVDVYTYRDSPAPGCPRIDSLSQKMNILLGNLADFSIASTNTCAVLTKLPSNA